jgi:hypothetical protein
LNTPTKAYLDLLLSLEASQTIGLGSGSIFVIAAPFTGGETTTVGGLVEANYPGYARQALSGDTVTFTGADGNEYVELGTFRFQPTGSSSPNLAYGIGLTYGASSTALAYTDTLATPVALSSPSNQLTVTVRVGRSTTGNYGLNIVSS